MAVSLGESATCEEMDRFAHMSQDTNYDTFAEAYNAENETSLLNAYYERPAMLKLAGQVQGKTILDVGRDAWGAQRRIAPTWGHGPRV